MAFDVRQYWNFDDPAASEMAVRELVAGGGLNLDGGGEVAAQLARAFSLRRDCDQCHQILLERWDEAIARGGRPKASYELERGRAFRSSGKADESKPYFEAAAKSEVDDLRIDALHMLAFLVEPAESTAINLRALSEARASTDPLAQRWQGTLCNNLGWTAFDEGRIEDAVGWFEQALAEREKYGVDGPIRIAKWCVARGYREQGRFDEALAIQLELEPSSHDGFVSEELGELFIAMGRAEEAKPHLVKAIQLLEPMFGSDSDRIGRLKSLLDG